MNIQRYKNVKENMHAIDHVSSFTPFRLIQNKDKLSNTKFRDVLGPSCLDYVRELTLILEKLKTVLLTSGIL